MFFFLQNMFIFIEENYKINFLTILCFYFLQKSSFLHFYQLDFY